MIKSSLLIYFPLYQKQRPHLKLAKIKLGPSEPKWQKYENFAGCSSKNRSNTFMNDNLHSATIHLEYKLTQYLNCNIEYSLISDYMYI